MKIIRSCPCLIQALWLLMVTHEDVFFGKILLYNHHVVWIAIWKMGCTSAEHSSQMCQVFFEHIGARWGRVKRTLAVVQACHESPKDEVDTVHYIRCDGTHDNTILICTKPQQRCSLFVKAEFFVHHGFPSSQDCHQGIIIDVTLSLWWLLWFQSHGNHCGPGPRTARNRPRPRRRRLRLRDGAGPSGPRGPRGPAAHGVRQRVPRGSRCSLRGHGGPTRLKIWSFSFSFSRCFSSFRRCFMKSFKCFNLDFRGRSHMLMLNVTLILWKIFIPVPQGYGRLVPLLQRRLGHRTARGLRHVTFHEALRDQLFHGALQGASPWWHLGPSFGPTKITGDWCPQNMFLSNCCPQKRERLGKVCLNGFHKWLPQEMQGLLHHMSLAAFGHACQQWGAKEYQGEGSLVCEPQAINKPVLCRFFAKIEPKKILQTFSFNIETQTFWSNHLICSFSNFWSKSSRLVAGCMLAKLALSHRMAASLITSSMRAWSSLSLRVDRDANIPTLL